MELYKRERRMEKLSFTEYLKSPKYILVMLTCLMLVSPMIASSVQAQFQPPQWPFPTLHLIVSNIREYMMGPWEIAAAIKAELAKIGITVDIVYKSPEIIWSDIYMHYWDKTYDEDPTHGWDMFFWEWWGAPTDMMWFTSMMHGTPPESWNVAGWNNSRADYLVHAATVEKDPALRKVYIRKLQEEVAWDMPYIPYYYLSVWTIINKKFSGYDDALFCWNVHQWNYSYPTPGGRPVTFARDDTMTNWNPHFMYAYFEEAVGDLCWDRLYTLEKTPEGEFGDCTMLATKLIEDCRWINDTCVEIPIRDDVWWVAYEGGSVVQKAKLTAHDVEMTYKAILDPHTTDVAYWDLSPFVEDVKALNDTCVQFDLTGPIGTGMLQCLLANEWGLQILPEDIMGGIDHEDWYTHVTNRNPMKIWTCGPFVVTNWKTDEKVDLIANPYYYLGEHQIKTFQFRIITDAASALVALEKGDVDMAAISPTPADIERLKKNPNLDAYICEVPCTEFIALNLHHPALTNRYVRQAIAHAIPVQKIIQDILPLYGVIGKPVHGWVWPMMDWAYYPELETTVYDLAEAKRLLDLWRYSNDAGNIGKSYVGDADFSGLVDLDDFLIWRKTAAGTNWNIPDNWYWSRGQGIDPDFDANGQADTTDLDIYWRPTTGTEYWSILIR